MRARSRPALLLLLVVAGASACARTPARPNATSEVGPSASAPTIRRAGVGAASTATPPDFQPLPGARALFGTLDKTVYRIEVPDRWNGELLMYAHPFRGNRDVVSVESPGVLRQVLIREGYAWAASSFSENGYVPDVAADETLALERLFEEKVGKPKRTYIAGTSMGANVVALSLENFPAEYDGGLALCGAFSGEELVDYLLAWIASAEFVAGVKLPPNPKTTADTAAVVSDWLTILGPLDWPTEKGRQYTSIMRMTTGGPRPFFQDGFREQFNLTFASASLDPSVFVMARAGSANQGFVYSIEPGLGLTADQISAGVRHLKAVPDPVPTSGKIGAPLLTLHNTGDLSVPLTQEQSYRRKVEAAGRSNLLVQRLVRAPGHCQFSEEEITTAWKDLRAWVAERKKPAGENVDGDLSDAGRQFTNPLRSGDPGGR